MFPSWKQTKRHLSVLFRTWGCGELTKKTRRKICLTINLLPKRKKGEGTSSRNDKISLYLCEDSIITIIIDNWEYFSLHKKQLSVGVVSISVSVVVCLCSRVSECVIMLLSHGELWFQYQKHKTIQTSQLVAIFWCCLLIRAEWQI